METSSEAEEAKAREVAERKAWREEQIRQLKIDSRIGLPYGMRLPLTTGIAFLAGASLGVAHGSQTTGLRFRAEHAHRLPTTPTGWYLYHKSKNYHMAMGGVKEGMKMGAKIGFWTAGFFSIEDMFDRYRGTKDFVNTILASLSVAGVFSLWSMHLLSTPTSSTNHNRPLSHHNRSENGEDFFNCGTSVWLGSRCVRSCKRKTTGLC